MKTRFAVIACLLMGLALTGCTNRSQGASTLDARVQQQDVQIQRLSSQVGQVEDSRPGQAEMWAQLQSMRQDVNSMNGKLYDLYEAKNTEVDMLKQRIYRLENVVRQMGSQMAINVDSLDAPINLDGPRTMPEGYTPYNSSVSQGAMPVTPGPAYAINPDAMDGGSPQANNGTGSGTGIAVTPDGHLSGSSSDASGERDTATTLYESGIRDFDERKYQDAVMTFKDFTSTFP